MLTIRLQRMGKKKYPTYRLVISEKARDTQGRYLENLGTFDPHDKEKGFVPKTERIQYWISQGATTSATVNNLFLKNKIIEGKKVKSVFLSKKRKAKLEEKQKVKAEKAAKKEEVKKEIPPVAEVTIKEEVKSEAVTE